MKPLDFYSNAILFVCTQILSIIRKPPNNNFARPATGFTISRLFYVLTLRFIECSEFVSLILRNRQELNKAFSSTRRAKVSINA